MGSTVKPPFLVALNLTRRCNLRCAHCYLDAGTRLDGDARELTTDEVRDILDGIATLSVETMVVFTGGEPTLRRDLPDLVSYAAGLGLMPVIGTNGTLLDDGRLQALKGAGLQGAGISIDSLNPSFHDDFRGLAGCWDKAMAGIDACRRIGIRFQIHFSVTEDNAHELDDMIAFAKSAKAFVLNVFFLVCTGRGEKFSDISPETYESVLRRVTQAAHDEQGLIVRAKCAPHFKRMALELDPAWPVTAAHGYEAGGCLAGTRYFRITPEGEVTACPYMEEPIGDLRQTDVATLWRDAPGFRRLREPKLEGRCGVCEYAKLCGGCRARPLARDGNMMGEDFVCTYQPQGGAVIEPLPDRGAGVVWTADAEVWLERIPSFVRRFVRQRAEDKVRADGGAEVTAEIIGALARERFKGRGGKTHQGNKRMTVDVAIIGGGISGLATAYSLKRLGLDVVVLERQARPGGNAQTERIGGFLMEHGPSTVNASSAAAAGFSKDLGLDAMRCNLGDAVRKRYLVAGGALSGISAGPMGFLTSGYLSLPGRLRMMAEFLLPHQLDGEDETVMAFFSRRFGKEFAERVIDPMVAGIYAGKASELSVSAVFPKLVALEREFGSVSLGMFRRYQQGAKMPGSRLYSWRDGIDTLPRALAARLGDGLRTGIAVRHVRRGPGGFKIDAGQAGSIEAKTVVLATQPHVAARFLDGLDDAAAAAAGEIKAPPLAVVFLGFRRDQVDHPLDGLGFLTSRGEKRLLSGAQFSSTMFPGRAPEECIAVTGYFGGARSPELARLSEGDLIGLARQEFSELIGAHGDPVVARVKHWPLGLPQYEIGHLKRAACLRDAEKRTPGLFITGNYFDGPSVASCLGLAKETAAAVSGYLADLEKPVDMDVWESAVSG